MAKNKKLFTKGQLVFIILGFLIVAITIFVYISFPIKNISTVNTAKSSVEAIPQYKKTKLDERFLVLYGKISSINNNLLKVSVIHDPNYTDSDFDYIPEVKVSLSDKTIVKNYNIDTKEEILSNISNINIGDYIMIYLEKNISPTATYSAIGLKTFNRDFINN